MAYQYDEFGNIVGEYESEEERRQREQEDLADTAVHTQEIKTYGDGTVEKVTKQEIPPELQRQQRAYQQVAEPIKAVSPEQAAYTRQQESGNRANIGYHFPANAEGKRQSTAYGPYGITEAAYKDIARQDPSLAKPITEWTQEEHDRGYNTLVGRNQARLTQLGIEPTAGVLQLSHLLGPDGAARFMKTGEVSAAAAAANGGAERLKQIAQGRFAGAQAASSGAAVRPPQAQPGQGVAVATGQGVEGTMETPEAPNAPVSPYSLATGNTGLGIQVPEAPKEFAPSSSQQHIEKYQDIQDDPQSLMKYSMDENVPENLRDRARNRVADLITQQREDAKVQQQMANMDENQIARAMRDRKPEGSRLKGALFAALGLKDLANEEAYKLGIGKDTYGIDADGNTVIVKVAANGKPISGVNMTLGTDMDEKQLANYVAQNTNAADMKTAQTQATHAYTSAYQSLMKQRDQLVQRNVSEADMAARGLDMASIQNRATKAGRDVIDAARRGYRSAPAALGQGNAQPGATPSNAPSTVPGAAAAGTTPAKPQSILTGWTSMRAGETPANFDKRQQYSPDDIESEAKQLIAGDKTIKDITGRDAGLLRHYATARAKELDPNWSATDSDARRDSLKKWTNPDSNVAKQVRAHITASNAIQDVRQAYEALQNGNMPLFNEIRNTFRTNTGSDLPIEAKTGAMILGPEIIKSIIPGGGGVAERLEAQHMLNTKLSPAQQAAVFKTLEEFQGNSLKALESDWTRAKLPKDQFRERVLGGSPAAQELYDTASKHQSAQAARRAGLTNVPNQADIDAELKRRGLK